MSSSGKQLEYVRWRKYWFSIEVVQERLVAFNCPGLQMLESRVCFFFSYCAHSFIFNVQLSASRSRLHQAESRCLSCNNSFTTNSKPRFGPWGKRSCLMWELWGQLSIGGGSVFGEVGGGHIVLLTAVIVPYVLREQFFIKYRKKNLLGIAKSVLNLFTSSTTIGLESHTLEK